MTLQWIAALLRPRDIGWHPNFHDAAYDSQPHVRLASRLAGDPWRWRPWRYEDEENPQVEDPVVDLAIACLEDPAGAGPLGDLAQAVLTGSLDVSRLVPFALLSCSLLSQGEEYDVALSVLDRALSAVRSQSSGPDRPLLLAALHQQRALRLRDTGEKFHLEIRRAVESLRTFEPERCDVFHLSPAVDSTSTSVLSHIREDLFDAAATSLTWDDDDLAAELGLRTSFERIRAGSPPNLISADRHRGHVLGELLDVRLGRKAGSTLQELAGELFFVNLHHEMLGHGRTHATRAQYAAFCLAEQVQPHLNEALPILRQSTDDKLLADALQEIGRRGPLTVLANDARQIIRHRLSPQKLGQPEVAVLDAASELLAPPEASIALHAVLRSLAGEGPANRLGHHTHSITRRRGAWLAAANLAAVCGMHGKVLDLLFTEVADSDADAQFVDHELAPAISALGEAVLDSETITKWRGLLEGRSLKMPRIREFFLRREGFVGVDRPEPGDAESARQAINHKLMGAEITEDDCVAHAQVLAEELAKTRADAKNGRFAYGGPDVPELAFFFITECACDWLYEPLTDFLTDHLIPQAMKAQALDRLAESSYPVPFAAARRFEQDAEDLLKWVPGLRFINREGMQPFPAALRFLGSHRLLPDAALVRHVADLIAEPDPLGRRQAARTISLMALTRTDIDFSGLAVALSNDGDLRVRSQAAIAVARYSQLSNVYKDSLLQALDRLLAEDGLLAPSWMIGALSELEGELSPEIRERLEAMATDHPSQRVRESAAHVVNAR